MSKVTDPNEALIGTAVFGKQIEAFLNTEIGRYLVKKAEREVEESFEGLKVCNPKDGAAVQAWQNKILTAEHFQAWLGEGISEGLQALKLLEGEDE